jgi:hypothetical protein
MILLGAWMISPVRGKKVYNQMKARHRGNNNYRNNNYKRHEGAYKVSVAQASA